MILSDRTIREQLDAGRIVVEPLGDNAIQPSSVDVRLDSSFRVFLNHTRRVIDVKEDLTDLTHRVDIDDDDAFILHPGEFVLASTREVITLPDDIVARIEGKSSLARLGLLIHSSLPGSEEVWVLDDRGRFSPRPIEEVVRKQLDASVMAFDPETFEVGFHPITGWYEGLADRILEIELASGRRVEVTGGHNVFTLDRRGELTKVRTSELVSGARIAVPRRLPNVPADAGPVEIHFVDHVPDETDSRLWVTGPTVSALVESQPAAVRASLEDVGLATTASFHMSRAQLPFSVARQFDGVVTRLGPDDILRWRGGRNGLPAVIQVDDDLAWTLGMYVAEGYRRAGQIVVSNTDQSRLDRLQHVFGRLGLPVHRSAAAVTISCAPLSDLLGWLGTGGRAPTKRVPGIVFGWPPALIERFVDGLVDGDGSDEGGRTSIWTTSPGLAGDLMVLWAMLGKRAGSHRRPARGNSLPCWQVYTPDREHKLLTSIPLPDRLLVELRGAAGISQANLARLAGYRHPTDLNNIERRSGRDAVRRRTVERLRDALAAAGADTHRLDRLADGDLAWDDVIAVRDTGRTETIYDLEVRPNGRKIENFLAGRGGVFVSNTAGFIDPGFSGHITLELANVATLPITLYPGMKIGQISFMYMTTPADVPYGAGAIGSKYQGQRGPTPSRYFENFAPEDADGG